MDKKIDLFSQVDFLVGEGGFEPPKLKAADLQSVPFGHSGTLPNPTTTTITQAKPFVKRKITEFSTFLRLQKSGLRIFLLTGGGKLAILCLF